MADADAALDCLLYVKQQLAKLVASGVLTGFQADWLLKHWNALSDDWASHPYLKSINEHTRLYIDQLRYRKQQP